jgi:hypothetical protein
MVIVRVRHLGGGGLNEPVPPRELHRSKCNSKVRSFLFLIPCLVIWVIRLQLTLSRTRKAKPTCSRLKEGTPQTPTRLSLNLDLKSCLKERSVAVNSRQTPGKKQPINLISSWLSTVSCTVGSAVLDSCDYNTYGYVLANPVSNVDPLGLWTGQVGVAINVTIGPFTVALGGGIAFDGHGNIAGYSEYGGGASVGADISGGLTIKGSNGDTINDLNGPFVNASVGGGAGPHGSADVFMGTGENGQTVTGGGITIGGGLGAGASTTITTTTVGNSIATKFGNPKTRAMQCK